MDNAGSSNEDEMVLHDDVKLSMDLIAACHLPDETLLGLTTGQRAEACGKLTHVRLDELQLDALDPGVLNQLTSCRSLYLQHNSLTSTAALSVLPGLTFLVLSHNQLRQVEGLKQLTSLLFVDISFNLIEQLEYAQLPDSIKYLKVAGNPCSAHTGLQQQLLTHLPRLKELDGVVLGKQQLATDTGTAKPQPLAGEDEVDSSEESETETGATDGVLGSYLLSMQQLEHQHVARLSAAAGQPTNSSASKPQAPATESQQLSSAQHGLHEPVSWVPDADCAKQLPSRVLLASNPGSSHQQQLGAEVSSVSLFELAKEQSNLLIPQLSVRSLSACPSSISRPLTASREGAIVTSKTTQQRPLTPGMNGLVSSLSSANGSQPAAGLLRTPRVLSRPQSAQTAAVLPVKPRLGGAAEPAASTNSVAAGPALVEALQPAAGLRKGSSTGATKPASAASTSTRPQARTGGAPANNKRQVIAASTTKPPSKATAGAAAAKGSVAAGNRVAGAAQAAASPSRAKPASASASVPPTAKQFVSQSHNQAAGRAQPASGSSSVTRSSSSKGSSSEASQGLPGTRRSTKAHAAESSSDVAATAAPRAGSAPPRKLPSLKGSTSAAAKAAAALTAGTDQQLPAVLLHPELDSPSATARKLAPVDHPALQAVSRPACAVCSRPASAVAKPARAAVETERSPEAAELSRDVGTHHVADSTRQSSQAGSASLATDRSSLVANDQIALSDSRTTAEDSMQDVRVSMVLDRSHVLQGCEAPVAVVQDMLAVEPSSAGAVLQAVPSTSSIVPAVTALDALAASSKEAISSAITAMKVRSRQRTQQMLQQQQQDTAARRQLAHSTMQQLKQQAGSLRQHEPEQQQLPQLPSAGQLVAAAVSNSPQNTSRIKGGAAVQKSTAGDSAPAVQALSAALQGLQGLRSGSGKDASGGSLPTQVAASKGSGSTEDLASRVARLKAKLAAAAEQLQTAVAEVHPAAVTAEKIPGLAAVLELQEDEDSSTVGTTAQVTREGDVTSGQQTSLQGAELHSSSIGSRTSSSDHDEGLSAEISSMLDRIFKPSLPVHEAFSSTDRVDPGKALVEETSTLGIPAGLFKSSLPPTMF